MVSDTRRVQRRDIWWADLGEPVGSLSGYTRPVVVIQSDDLNVSRLRTYLCVPCSTNMWYARIPWNLLLRAAATGLSEDCVAQTHLTLAVDSSQLLEHVSQISEARLRELLDRLDIALGRT